ncbi:MAG TPA: hypothetical protein VI282_12910 [Verrucomicrobiae bacterium]|jgi:hypothetical protein
MKVRQWEVWKTRPEGFQTDHWFVVISGQERCEAANLRLVNGLACFTLRGRMLPTDVQLNGADGFSAPTVCPCDFIYSLEKTKLHSGHGLISWERQQQIKSKIKELLRL